MGVTQLFCRPHAPDDNAEMEAFFATLKCERLYRGSYDHLLEAEEDIGRFIDYYNGVRLHQGIGFVTPNERHEGRDRELREERRQGLQLARLLRFMENGGGARPRGELELEDLTLVNGAPALQAGVNEEVAGARDCSIIFSGVVS